MKGIEKYFNKKAAKKMGKKQFVELHNKHCIAFMHNSGISDAEQIWYALFPDYKQEEVKKPKVKE